MNQIVIIGSTGCGKSTLAARLAKNLGLTQIDLDDLFWNPGWVQTEAEPFREKIIKAIPEDRWIVTGNYKSMRDLIWSQADTIIWIDYSFRHPEQWPNIKRYIRLSNPSETNTFIESTTVSHSTRLQTY